MSLNPETSRRPDGGFRERTLLRDLFASRRRSRAFTSSAWTSFLTPRHRRKATKRKRSAKPNRSGRRHALPRTGRRRPHRRTSWQAPPRRRNRLPLRTRSPQARDALPESARSCFPEKPALLTTPIWNASEPVPSINLPPARCLAMSGLLSLTSLKKIAASPGLTFSAFWRRRDITSGQSLSFDQKPRGRMPFQPAGATSIM
ncbi:MAG: hypothetical protein QOF46_2288 [Paraburkholderia sp.]|nr:hypothetical protein [Paraburkholderia sp.]